MRSATVAAAISTLAILSSVSMAGVEEGTGARSTEPIVVRHYDENNPAPDYVVFRHYVGLVGSFPDERVPGDDKHEYTKVHFLVHSMDFDHDDAGRQRAEELSAFLVRVHHKIDAAIQRAEKQALCTPGAQHQSDDDLYESMDRLADTRDQIGEKYYLKTVRKLDSDTAVRLDRALQETKETFASVRYSHKSMYENSDVDVQDWTKSICKKLNNK